MTAALEPASTGLFGGTFNPIHLGHLRVAEEAAEQLGLERVVFIPAATPPHKAPSPDDVLAPAQARLEWVRAAVAGNPRFEVDPLEIERDGLSFSVDTLRHYGEKLAPARPVFLIGQDAFAEIGSWREPEALFALAHFVVLTRPPERGATLREGLPASLAGEIALAPDARSGIHRRSGTWIRLLPVPLLQISASEIRARLRAGRSVRYLLPDPVHDAVLRSRVYAGPEGR